MPVVDLASEEAIQKAKAESMRAHKKQKKKKKIYIIESDGETSSDEEEEPEKKPDPHQAQLDKMREILRDQKFSKR